jgi:hypothetical protein
VTTTPTGDLHRIAPSGTPWQAYQGAKFQERFDDPQRKYFVLYASSQRLGCFLECLAYFRVEPDKPGFEDLQEKFGDSFPAGAVPPSWFPDRFIQTAKVTGAFADVAGSSWIATLLKEFPDYLRQGSTYPWIDQSTIYQDKFRAITQWISRTVFERSETFAGLYYSSKLGSDFSNWAIFEERASISALGPLHAVTENDIDLLKACSSLDLKPPTAVSTLPAKSFTLTAASLPAPSG